MRISVNNVLGWLAHGMTEEQILEEQPGLEKEDFPAVYAFAAEVADTAYGRKWAVRVLLDQNLSPKLIGRLADLIPGLESVYDHALTGASDPAIFEWARSNEFTALISTDRDFVHFVDRAGPPPKIIRIEQCDFPSQ
jgi:predicted nuclease of predicted toxin-antitoxin system